MFCSICGKEISPEMKFCPICGKEIETSQYYKNVETQASNDNKDKSAIIKGMAAFLIFFVLLLFFWAAGSNETVEVGEDSPSCPTQDETNAAVFDYVNGKIIKKIDGQLNTVWITETAEAQMGYNDLQTLGYIAACYSAYEKNYNLVWADIKSWKTNKTIAKYSQSYGFKMKK